MIQDKKKIKILIIEDSAADAELIQLELSNNGYIPVSTRVETGGAFRESLKHTDWDLITSDYKMPHFSALEAINIWKESGVDAPLFIISGIINQDEAISLIKAGATEYITKDHLSRLAPAMERELHEVCERRKRKNIEQELNASQNLHRLITENMTDYVWIMNLKNKKITYFNPAALKNLGYSSSDINNLTISDILSEESASSLFQIADLIIKDYPGSTKSLQQEYLRKDKSGFWCEDVLEVMHSNTQQNTQILVVGRDITLRKKQQEDLIKSRDYIWSIFENFPALIWRSGLDGLCNYFNQSWLNWTGRTLEQEMGVGWAEGVHPEDYQSCMDQYLHAFNLHEPFQMEYRLKHESGEYRWILDIGRPFNDLDGNFAGYIGSCFDVNDARKNRELLVARAQKMEKLYELTRDFNNIQSLSSLYELICDKSSEMMGVPHAGLSIYDAKKDVLTVKCVWGSDQPTGREIHRKEGISGQVLETLRPLVVKDPLTNDGLVLKNMDISLSTVMVLPMIYGSEILGALELGDFAPSPKEFSEDDLKWASLLANVAASAIHNIEQHQITQATADQLAMLYDSGLALNSMLEPHKQLSFLLQLARQALNCERVAFLDHLPERDKVIFLMGDGLPDAFCSSLIGKEFSTTQEGSLLWRLINHALPVRYSDKELDGQSPFVDPTQKSYIMVPVIHDRKVIGILAASDSKEEKFSSTDERMMVLFSNQTAVSIINAKMFTEIKNRSAELEAMAKISAALRKVQTSSEFMPIILSSLTKLTSAKSASYIKLSNNETCYIVEDSFGKNALEVNSKLSDEIVKALQLEKDKAVRLSEKELKQHNLKLSLFSTSHDVVLVPLFIQQKNSGYLLLETDKGFEDNIFHILAAVADMAANAIHRATLHEETQNRLSKLSILRSIDDAIASSTDLSFILNFLVNQIKEKLHVDAVAILLYDSITNYLVHAASIGFMNKDISKLKVRIGESFAGKAVIEKKTFKIKDTNRELGVFHGLSPYVSNENFTELIGNPLYAKGKLVGVLEVFQRESIDVDEEWMDFLSGIAQQAAIAIDNARLFEELERSNYHLIAAYESTLEGWSRTLEVRDLETAGHSKRVVDMTMEIALQVGMNSEKMVHLRRGALLHDIGKLGIPDSILQKPGKLDPEERIIIEKHPEISRNLLEPIEYLVPAMDIPYCHHEKWNGTGYPRGLKGTEIPLAARIFAVVDVWDALTSDRVYRPAWQADKALEYLRSESGTHFDPDIVDVFLSIYGNHSR